MKIGIALMVIAVVGFAFTVNCLSSHCCMTFGSACLILAGCGLGLGCRGACAEFKKQGEIDEKRKPKIQ